MFVINVCLESSFLFSSVVASVAFIDIVFMLLLHVSLKILTMHRLIIARGTFEHEPLVFGFDVIIEVALCF